MFRTLSTVLTLLFCVLFAGVAAAQTVGTTTNPGSFSTISNTQTVVGQRIVAPAAGLKLQSYRFSLSATSSLDVEPVVYEVTAGAATSLGALTLSELWSGPATSVTNDGVTRDYLFTPGTTIALDPAKIYVVAVRQGTAGQTGTIYRAADAYAPGDQAVRNVAGNFVGVIGDTGFQATFAPVAPAPVPTLSEWAMLLFGTILAGGAALYIQRRRLSV